MNQQPFDLILKAGRVFCAETGLDGPGAVAVRGAAIEASGADVSGETKKTLNFPDGILLLGLVDLHTHPAPLEWRFGIGPDKAMLARGTTTAMSQGDAGAWTWPEYRSRIIESSQTRIRLAISPAVKGEHENRGCFEVLDEVDVDACVAAIEEGGDLIWGVAANLTDRACGDNDPKEIMRRTLAAAERTQRPILYGVRREPSDWPLAEQLELLRPGDVFTYCFHADAESIVSGNHIVDEVWKAQDRGIIFDVGHGKGDSDMGVAAAAVADGFLPDTVSTDVFNKHLDWSPPHDMPRTISRLIAIGMPENEAFIRSTLRPAQILGLAGEVGTLASGACADLVVLQWSDDTEPLVELEGGFRSGRCLSPVLTVRAGNLVRVV